MCCCRVYLWANKLQQHCVCRPTREYTRCGHFAALGDPHVFGPAWPSPRSALLAVRRSTPQCSHYESVPRKSLEKIWLSCRPRFDGELTMVEPGIDSVRRSFVHIRRDNTAATSRRGQRIRESQYICGRQIDESPYNSDHGDRGELL
jgi:hypothetical protein